LPTKRILKVNKLLKKELGQLFLKEVEFPKDVLVTITRIDTSPDLKEAIVSISSLPDSKSQIVQKILSYRIYDLQQEINKKLRMRPVPKIIFREEEKVGQAARIEELLQKINKEVDRS
jgi:ribosome-binding factor A